ncbi:MAG: prepilin-type N-terminal cleavage/methylation domain-containing protein [Rhizomicrobium sp.]|jgi:prepilin-type N-terminal cleavage/methylation domain-containing protein
MSAAGNEAGFTLLEMLVVLGLLSLISMIAIPDFERVIGLLELRETAATLQANLRVIRADALRSDQEVDFALDGDGKGYQWSEVEKRRVPDRVDLRMAKGQAIVFYGDGTTSGGAVKVLSGGREILIIVDESTGAVSTGQ